MKKLFYVAMILIYANAYSVTYSTDQGEDEEGGGIYVGNGGKVVRCLEHAEIQYYALDSFEVKDKSKIDIPLISNEVDINSILDRLNTLDPVRAIRLKKYYREFTKQLHLVENNQIFKLGDLSDTGVILLPVGCSAVQAIVQVPDLNSTTKNSVKYYINNLIWKKMSPQEQGVLALHEIVYRDLSLHSKHNTSYFVRHFVRLLITNRFASYSLKDYIKKLQQLMIRDFRYNASLINLSATNALTFYSNGNMIKTAKLLSPFTRKILGTKLELVVTENAQFYKNGSMIFLYPLLAKNRVSKEYFWSFLVDKVLIELSLTPDKIKLNPDRSIAQMRLSRMAPHKLIYKGRSHKIKPGTIIYFNAEGKAPSFIPGLEISNDIRPTRLFLTKKFLSNMNNR